MLARSCCVIQDDLKLRIFVPLAAQVSGYRHVSQCPSVHALLMASYPRVNASFLEVVFLVCIVRGYLILTLRGGISSVLSSFIHSVISPTKKKDQIFFMCAVKSFR